MEGAFPDKVTVRKVRKTYEQRDIKLIRVSNSPNSKKPAILMDCGIHAREWVSPAFCLYTLDRLVETGAMLDKYDVYIIPVANPDGKSICLDCFQWSVTTDRNGCN